MRYPLAPLLLGLALTAALAAPHLPARAEEKTEGPLTHLRAVSDGWQVLSLAFSPDGKTLATGNADLTAKLRDGLTGELRYTFPAETRVGAHVRAVQFTPDGKQLVTLADEEVKVWDARTYTLQQTLSRGTGRLGRLMSLALSPDGKRVAAGGELSFGLNSEKYPSAKFGRSMGRVWIWDLATGMLEKNLIHPGSGEVVSLAFSPRGKTLAGGGQNGSIQRWAGDDYKPEPLIPAHSGPVWVLAYSPSGKQLASGGGDNEVIAWDEPSGKRLRTFSGHRHLVLSLAFSPNGKLLASGSYDETLKLWNPATGALRQSLPVGGWVHSLQFSPDGSRLAGGLHHKEQALRIWDVEE